METEGNGLACSVYFLCCVVLFILSFPAAGLVSLLPPKRAFVVFALLLCLAVPFAVCALSLGPANLLQVGGPADLDFAGPIEDGQRSTPLLGPGGPAKLLTFVCLAAGFFLPFAAGMGFVLSKARYPEE